MGNSLLPPATGTQFCPKWGPNFESDGDLMVTSASRNGDPNAYFWKLIETSYLGKNVGTFWGPMWGPFGAPKKWKRYSWGPGSPNGDPRWSSGNYVNWHKRCPRFEELRNVYLCTIFISNIKYTILYVFVCHTKGKYMQRLCSNILLKASQGWSLPSEHSPSKRGSGPVFLLKGLTGGQ